MKVVVLGGYGNFGARICRALAGDPAIQLVVAGRNARRAADVAEAVGGAAASVDIGSPALAETLRGLAADLVVHTAGPFQGQAYGVARAAATAGCHYIDLADGRRFVCDFADQLDAVFKSANRTAVTGASTVPALSSAVVDASLPRFLRLDSIDVCIAPAQRAPRGEATLAGVLSYCGAPISVWEDGQWRTRHGWEIPERIRFARLAARRGALCDIPDLELLPGRYPGVREVMFRAALEVGVTQWAFAGFAALRKRGWMSRPEALAGLLYRLGAVFDWFGSADGGMVVRVSGLDMRGDPLKLAWHITAPDHNGPEIPCMPAILLARRLAHGEPLPTGAMPCLGLLALSDFRHEFQRWKMTAEWQEESVDGA